MRFDTGQLTELLDQVKWEGNPRLLLAPVPVLPAGLALPQVWRDLLMRDDAHRQAASLLWPSAARALNRVVTAMGETLQAVGLLTTEIKRPSLVYIFTKRGEVFARRGYLPSENLPPLSSKLSVDLSVFYRIHDGWVDFFSGDTGPLPVEEWQVLGKSETDTEQGFLEVFTAGGNGIGFDLSEDPSGSYMISSDEDVTPVDDFWGKLDSWISAELQEMDRSTE